MFTVRVPAVVWLCAALTAGATEMRVVDYAPANCTPTYDRGHMVVYELSPGLRIHGPDGQVMYRYAPAKGYPQTAAFQGDGNGAAGVNHWSAEHSGAIVYLDRAGTVTRVVETPGYIPAGLSFAEDGSLWVLGARPPGSKADYHLVRRYSKDGRELGRYILRSSVGGNGEPVVPGHGAWHIRTSENRVGIHLFNSDPRLWLEITFDGVEQGRWTVDFDGGPAAFTRSGDVFGESETGRLMLDHSDGKWKTVNIPGDGRLVGVDGDELLLLDRAGWLHNVAAQP